MDYKIIFSILLIGMLLFSGCTTSSTPEGNDNGTQGQKPMQTYECPDGTIVTDINACENETSNLQFLVQELNSEYNDLDNAVNNQDFTKIKSLLLDIKITIKEIKKISDDKQNEKCDICVLNVLDNYEGYIYLLEDINNDPNSIYYPYTLATCKDLEDTSISNLNQCKNLENSENSDLDFARGVQELISSKCLFINMLQNFTKIINGAQLKEQEALVYLSADDYKTAELIYENISDDLFLLKISFNLLCQELDSTNILSENKKEYYSSYCSYYVELLNEMSLLYSDLSDYVNLLELYKNDQLGYNECISVVNNLSIRKTNLDALGQKQIELNSPKLSTYILNIKINLESLCNKVK